MKNLIKVILILITFQLVAGCATINGFPDPPSTSTAVYPEPNYLLGDNALKKYTEEPAASKKELRNEIIDARMQEIDKKFEDFERALYKQGIGFGIGTDWVALALTATAVIVHGATSKTAIAAIATGVVGASAAFDKQVLFDKTLPVIIASMVAQRETTRASIRASEELPIESYTIYAALSDLQRFEFAGSIPGSLQSMAVDAGQKAATAQKRQDDIIASLQPLTKEIHDQKQALTEANGKLGDSDIEKAKKALTLLDPTVKPADNIAAIKEQLQGYIRGARTPARIAEVAKAFKDAGITIEE